MHEQKISIAGAVTYWTLAEFSDARKLEEGFKALGLEGHAPTRPTHLVALKRALVEVFTKRKHLVRPLKSETFPRFAVVREEAGHDEIDYEIIFRVEADDLDNLHFDNPDHPAVPAIDEAYRKQRGQVPSGAVGSALSRLAHMLGGVRLRDSGGVFWLPAESMEKWNAIAGVVMSAADEGRACVYRLRTAIDESTIEAVGDAITRDVEDSVADIRKKLGSQERASSFEKRKEEAVALDARITKYEQVLGRTLEHLREKAKAAEQEASLAALAAIGGSTQ